MYNVQVYKDQITLKKVTYRAMLPSLKMTIFFVVKPSSLISLNQEDKIAYIQKKFDMVDIVCMVNMVHMAMAITPFTTNKQQI